MGLTPRVCVRVSEQNPAASCSTGADQNTQPPVPFDWAATQTQKAPPPGRRGGPSLVFPPPRCPPTLRHPGARLPSAWLPLSVCWEGPVLPGSVYLGDRCLVACPGCRATVAKEDCCPGLPASQPGFSEPGGGCGPAWRPLRCWSTGRRQAGWLRAPTRTAASLGPCPTDSGTGRPWRPMSCE